MFNKAEKKGVWLKLAITGTSGAGKTTAALRLMRGLLDGLYGVGKERFCAIDTENRSMSLYADKFDFDVCNVEPPFDDFEKFITPIDEAVKSGYRGIIIDSASHVWEGVLDYKAKLDSNPRTNSYTNWNQAGNRFKRIIDAVLKSEIHVICCMRSKMDYAIEKDDKGKNQVRKVGLAPIMRDGIEYEFSAVFDLNMQHLCEVSKDRTRLFDGKIFEITEKTGQELAKWCGESPNAPQPPAQNRFFTDDESQKAKAWADALNAKCYSAAMSEMKISNLTECEISRKPEFLKIVRAIAQKNNELDNPQIANTKR